MSSIEQVLHKYNRLSVHVYQCAYIDDILLTFDVYTCIMKTDERNVDERKKQMFQLIAITELREYDYLRDEYIPLEKGEGNICERCGREHAKVYVVKSPEREYHVGSGCCKKLLNWEPSRDEVNAFEQTRKSIIRSESKRLMTEFISNTVAAMVKEASRLNKQQGFIHVAQVDEIASQLIMPTLSGSKKQKFITEKITRKFWNTPCPLVVW